MRNRQAAEARGAAASARPKRFARLREKWRNTSLKTSFMGYMLAFLLAALVLSSVTASVFTALQSEMTADAYEVSGIYLYDANENMLVPARSLAIDKEGNELFVQRAEDSRQPLSLDNPPKSLVIESARNYPYVYEVTESESGELTLEEHFAGRGDLAAFEGPEGIAASDVAAYDALARDAFEAWAAERADNPYRVFLNPDASDPAQDETGRSPAPDGMADGSANDSGPSASARTPRFGDLLVSPVGYYAHTEPSEEARALSTLFSLLAFLMFPLWFGACIFAAARRFYRERLAPGLSALDDAAAKIADENLDFHVSYERSDELGRLAASFEKMRASLAESQQALWRTAEERKRLNAAFAHDLRTPLTILKGKVELLDAHLRSGDAEPEQLARSAASLAAQVERLERYVAAMSGLQKLEDRVAEPTAQTFDAVAEAVDEIGRALCARPDEANDPVPDEDIERKDGEAGRCAAFALSLGARCHAERPPLFSTFPWWSKWPRTSWGTPPATPLRGLTRASTCATGSSCSWWRTTGRASPPTRSREAAPPSSARRRRKTTSAWASTSPRCSARSTADP